MTHQLSPTPRQQIEALLLQIAYTGTEAPTRVALPSGVPEHVMIDRALREDIAHLQQLAGQALEILRARTHDGSRRPMKDAPRDGTEILARCLPDFPKGSPVRDCADKQYIVSYSFNIWVNQFGTAFEDEDFIGWLPIPKVQP